MFQRAPCCTKSLNTSRSPCAAARLIGGSAKPLPLISTPSTFNSIAAVLTRPCTEAAESGSGLQQKGLHRQSYGGTNSLAAHLDIEVGRARWRSDIADKTTGVLSARRGSWGTKQGANAAEIGKRCCFSNMCKMLACLCYALAG